MSLFRRIGGALLFLMVLSLPAMAGPNAGGSLVLHNTGATVTTTNDQPLCEVGTVPTGLGDVVARIDGAEPTDPAIFRVYAIFPEGSTPRLKGLTFGIDYDSTKLVVLFGAGTTTGACPGYYELADTEPIPWPEQGSGTSLIWDAGGDGVLTDRIIPTYYFMGYVYNNGGPSQFALIPHPTQGGNFIDDTQPTGVLDPIVGYGIMGFDMDGYVPPQGGDPGACCNYATGACTVITAQQCGSQLFKGAGTACDPYPCGTGACCGLSGGPGFYCEDMVVSECRSQGGAFLGLDTDCATDAPQGCAEGQWGACCVGTDCVVTYQADCSGIWLVDINCNAAPCGPDLGACCLGENCNVTAASQCNGVFILASGCTPNPCASDLGACCGLGSCEVVSEANCSTPEHYFMLGEDCQAQACMTLGACCHWNAECEVTTELDCDRPEYWFAGHPCYPSDYCATPVEVTSWGKIKATYSGR